MIITALCVTIIAILIVLMLDDTDNKTGNNSNKKSLAILVINFSSVFSFAIYLWLCLLKARDNGDLCTANYFKFFAKFLTEDTKTTKTALYFFEFIEISENFYKFLWTLLNLHD